MDLDIIFVADVSFDQKLHYVLALITLQLNDFADILILQNGAVRRERLLEVAKDFLEVEIGGHALHSGQRFTTVALLNADVHH